MNLKYDNFTDIESKLSAELMILTVTYDSIWCICWCFIRRP